MARKSIADIRRKLLAWYARAARDLPWRRTRDPYRVLVSEVMLQQTQVSRVEEYYARARNLHSLAKGVVGRGVAGRGAAGKGVAGGSVTGLPEDPDELMKLPGIGPYTAGAVASFAYERPVPAVD